MALVLGRIEIGNAGTRAAFGEVLEEVVGPTSDDWTVELPGEGELVVHGPRRLRPPEPEWHVVPTPTGARYSRVLPQSERSPCAFRAIVRRLVWEHIDVRENAVAVEDPETAEELEHAAWRVLSGHDLPPVQLRLATWRGDDVARFVCKVESRTLGPGGSAPWRWWSPLLTSGEELTAWLRAQVVDGRARSMGPRVAERALPFPGLVATPATA